MRKAKPRKHVILPDPVFNDQMVSKFVNHLMYDGKKNTSFTIFYNALDIVKDKMSKEEKELSLGLGGLHGISNENLSGAVIGNKEPIIVRESPNKQDVEELGKELDALDQAEPGTTKYELNSTTPTESNKPIEPTNN